MSILDFLFPKHCVLCKKFGSYLCDNCFSYLSFDVKTLCLVCNKPCFDSLTHPGCKSKYAIDGCFSALPYNRTAKKLISSFKYKPFLTDLKKVLADLFYEGIIQKEELVSELKKAEWIIVPVPLFDSKLRKRGYNQSEILAKELGKKLNIPVENLLKRTRDTKTQVGLKVEDRKKNIKDAFEIIPNTKYLIHNTFLVDDVVTTGSTLLECANVLKRNGAKKVIGLTLARD